MCGFLKVNLIILVATHVLHWLLGAVCTLKEN